MKPLKHTQEFYAMYANDDLTLSKTGNIHRIDPFRRKFENMKMIE